MKLSIVIPAHNEEQNLPITFHEIHEVVHLQNGIDYELVCVNDCSHDNTGQVIQDAAIENPRIRMVQRQAPGGFGRAIRSGIANVTGDVVVICMADQSDDPKDIVAYYKKILEGYDCVFGSRFIKGSVVQDYPWFKLIVNRIVNRCVQLLFWTRFNDLTNAFKAYRTDVIQNCGPYKASHFNITLEMSLSALIRHYNIAQIPISWYGRKWGSSNLRLSVMGRKYLCTTMMMFFQQILIKDDLLAEKLMQSAQAERSVDQLRRRLSEVEERMAAIEAASQQPSSGRSPEKVSGTN